MIKRVMKGVELDAIGHLSFPVLTSPKLDGIRAFKQGVLLSASMKPLRNKFVQERFKDLPNGVDGELILGEPNTPGVYRRTNSAVMRLEEEPDVYFYVFDYYDPLKGFWHRLARLGELDHPYVKIVPHQLIPNLDLLEQSYQEYLDQGYEGLIVRSTQGPYKQGRATAREGYLFKKKPFLESDAVVEGWYRLKTNTNTSFINESGLKEKSTRLEGIQELDLIGGLEVRDIHTGVAFKIGILDAENHQKLWGVRDKLKGLYIKYKYFSIGDYDKPRHPVFLDFRDPIDITE